MDWYVVVKTIKGKRYHYRQKTWREGGRVRTLSQYIGPAGDGDPTAAAPIAPKPKASRQLAADSLKLLMGDKAEDWEHHWEADRRGDVLIKKYKHIEQAFKSLNVKWTHSAEGAYFNPRTGVVNIPPLRCFVDKNGQSATSAYYVVTFHELVHWTKLHLNRETGLFGHLYAREELVAELGAIMLMRHFGLKIGNEGRHALYFQTWLERTDMPEKALQFAQVEAQRAVRLILKRGTMKL